LTIRIQLVIAANMNPRIEIEGIGERGITKVLKSRKFNEIAEALDAFALCCLFIEVLEGDKS